MRLPALAWLVVLAAAFPARAADDARKAYSALVAEMNKAANAAPEADRRKVTFEYAGKFLAHAAKHPKDPTAVHAAMRVIQMIPPGRGEARAKAVELLKGDVGKQEVVRRYLRTLAGNPADEEGFDVVAGMVKNHPDRTVRAWACQAVVKAYEGRAAQAAQLEKNAAFREQAEKSLGKEAVARLIESAPNARLRARQFKKRLDKDFPGVFPDLSVGKPAPELILEDLDGKKVKLSDLKGKVVVLDFWATWCGYCVRMIPHEREMVKRLKGKPFVLVSISGDDSKEKVARFLERTPMPWTHWYMGNGSEVIDTWEVDAYPMIFVLDHKGVIRYKDVRDKKMDEAVDDLLKEMEEEKGQ